MIERHVRENVHIPTVAVLLFPSGCCVWHSMKEMEPDNSGKAGSAMTPFLSSTV